MPDTPKSFSIPNWVIYGALLLGGTGGGTVGTKLVDSFTAQAAPMNIELIEYRLAQIESQLTELNNCCNAKFKDE